jgi:hypothetical protein
MLDVKSKAVPVSEILAAVADPPEPRTRGPLSEEDAIEIWIARWLRVRRKDLVSRYACDPRRLYEIWEGTRHPAAREKARAMFAVRYPALVERIDFGNHRRISRAVDPDQLALFD